MDTYEYKVDVIIGWEKSRNKSEKQKMINSYARNGWRFSSEIIKNGDLSLTFERIKSDVEKKEEKKQ